MKKTILILFGFYLIINITRFFIIDCYTISSGSMGNTLLVGDRVLVNKLEYGPRLPRSYYEIPFINAIVSAFSNVNEDLNSHVWAYYRVKSKDQIKNGDIVVFNNINKAFDFLIKRCIALPGDSLLIKNGNLYINGKLQDFPCEGKSEFKIYYNNFRKASKQFDSLIKYNNLNFSNFNYNSFNKFNCLDGDIKGKDQAKYLIADISFKQKNNIERLSAIDSVTYKISRSDNLRELFPKDTFFHWSIDDYGVVVPPKEGMQIILNYRNYVLYKSIIENLEKNKIRKSTRGFYIGFKPIKSYRFNYNYYFMLGDNRHQSLDSRYIGFIPESHIIGKATRILFSKEPNGKIRWHRVLKTIK